MLIYFLIRVVVVLRRGSVGKTKTTVRAQRQMLGSKEAELVL